MADKFALFTFIKILRIYGWVNLGFCTFEFNLWNLTEIFSNIVGGPRFFWKSGGLGDLEKGDTLSRHGFKEILGIDERIFVISL